MLTNQLCLAGYGWTRRAKKSRSFEIQTIKGKGQGAVAVFPDSTGSSRRTDAEIEAMISALPAEQQDMHDQAALGKSSLRIGKICEEEGLAVFNMLARFNHSCVPNVHNSWNIETKTETLHAVRDVAKGTELCTTPKEERRALLQRLKFTCNCEACAAGAAAGAASDERRQELGQLARRARQLEDGRADVAALQQAVQRSIKLIDLASRQGKLRPGSAAFEAAAELGDLEMAYDMSKLALDTTWVVGGSRCPALLSRGQPQVGEMTLPTWALDYPPLEERKFPGRYSGDYFRDTLPNDLYELEQAVVDGDVFTVRKLLQASPDSPVVGGEYLKSKGSQHTWWGACCDFNRVKEYVDNGQDVDEVNPVLWNGNGDICCITLWDVAQEFGHNHISQYLLTKGGTVVVRNCHTIDTHEMKWSIGRGDAFIYKAGGHTAD
eukprot:Skav234601  [mRNA]  locus=scaffold5214:253044:269148:- [translate_table: standard]